MRKHSGEIRFVHERCDHLRDAAGKIVRSVGMVHDITERKRAEAALCESERACDLQATAVRSAFTSGMRPVTRPTGAAPKPTSCSADRMPRRPSSWPACVHPDDRGEAAAPWPRLLLLDRSQPVPGAQRDEYRVIQRDGRVVWLEAVNTVTREGDDLVIRGGVRDITARKRAEALLAERNPPRRGSECD